MHVKFTNLSKFKDATCQLSKNATDSLNAVLVDILTNEHPGTVTLSTTDHDSEFDIVWYSEDTPIKWGKLIQFENDEWGIA